MALGYDVISSGADISQSSTIDDAKDSCDLLSHNTIQPGHYNFMQQHSLAQSHRSKCISEVDALVPNFVGGTLPRCNQGDREYYCCTVLTLFKPWRCGYDLKDKMQLWDETFLEHKFTNRQTILMQHFNIQYECLDGCDNFFAQLRKILISCLVGHLLMLT